MAVKILKIDGKSDVVVASQKLGIELRNPYCDYRIVEFTNSIDLNLLFFGKEFKYMLKKIVLDKFGVNLFNNRKRGFAPEIVELIKIPAVHDMIKNIITEESIEFYFPELEFDSIKSNFDSYTVFSAQCLLNLYMYISVMDGYDCM